MADAINDRAEFHHAELMAKLARIEQLSERAANLATGAVVIIVAACVLTAALIVAVR